MEKKITITLDGPGGSGKTTIAKMLAKKLGIAYLDTGAMYRGVACYVKAKGIAFDDVEGVLGVLDEINMQIVLDGEEQKVIINKKDYTPELRTPDISMGASTVSKIPEVRLKLVEIQRKIARENSAVLDGRDMGSYVLPEAEYKFYLTADVDVRAKRRYLELKEKREVTLEQVKVEMIARDEQDSSRAFAPLCVPQGAYVIDTTNLNLDEVMTIISEKIGDKQ